MRKGSKRKAFSMMELMVTVVVLTIIASIAIFSYQGYQDRAAMLRDETNQKIWYTAVQMDAASTGTIAGSLSELSPEVLDRAYALVINEKSRPYTLLAYLDEQWRQWWGSPVAESSTYVPSNYYSRDVNVLRCPSDKRRNLATSFNASGRPNGPISYAISSGEDGAAGKPYAWFKNSINADKDLIIESDDGITAVYRHHHGNTAVIINARGQHKRITLTGGSGGQEGGGYSSGGGEGRGGGGPN